MCVFIYLQTTPYEQKFVLKTTIKNVFTNNLNTLSTKQRFRIKKVLKKQMNRYNF